MSDVFYPNDCIVCRKRTSLKRCSRCQMISYCGEIHQKDHWHLHKDMCRVISTLTKTKNLSHLYEDLRGCSLSKWAESRNTMCDKIISILGRNLKSFESQMLHYPRSCFVCYDTCQSNLTNCPRCPLVSFCKEHPQSFSHNKMCSDVICCYTLETGESQIVPAAEIVFKSCFLFPQNMKKLPTTTNEFLDAALKSQTRLTQKLKLTASMMVYYPLTIFGAAQKLNKTSSTSVTVYIHLRDDFNLFRKFVEILLHVWTNLNSLTIVLENSLKTFTEELPLCQKCTIKDRRLIIQHHNSLAGYDFKSIDLAVFNNLNPGTENDMRFQAFKEVRHIWNKFECPIILTTGTEIAMRRVKNYFESVCPRQTIFYDGVNDFASLYYYRYWENWKIAKLSEFLLISKPSTNPKPIVKESESVSKVVKEEKEKKIEPNVEKNSKQFYSGICHVCKSANAMISCTRCKMVFYCDNKHMKSNQPEHKEICKVILGFLNEKGTAHLFDNSKTNDENSWLEAKVNFMKQAKLKLNRDLLNFEQQIFLFPKTCFVCHESDLSVLKTCKCSISLCKIHREDMEHKNLCEHFQVNLHLERNKIQVKDLIVPNISNEKRKHLPSSINHFIDSFFYPLKSSENNIQKIVISDLMTRPLTIIYALEKLNISVTESLAIHVVGATNEEFDNIDYWNFLLYWFKNLKSLFIDFIGLEITEHDNFSLDKSHINFLFSSDLVEKELRFKSYKKRYENYCASKDFDRPDLIVGYNLNIHESNYGTSDCTWQETFSIIGQMNVPFLMTATSRERATKDHEMLCSLLDKTINYEFSEINPYCSLKPERDFETERLCYSNSCIIAYKTFKRAKILKKASEEQFASVENKNCVPNPKTDVEKKKEMEKCKNSSDVKDSKLGFEKKSDKISNGKLSKLKENSDVNVQKPAESSEQVKLRNELLLKENEQLQQTNKILKENLRLKEENERLKNEILKLNLKE